MKFNDYFSEIAHRANQSPEEICGFLRFDGLGSLSVHPVPNVSPNDKSEEFEVSLADQLKFNDANTFALYHSHIKVDENLGEQDIRTSEEAEIPMLVYSVKTNKFQLHTPKVCVPEYCGRKFVLGVRDCVQLVTDWLRQERNVILPFFKRDESIVTNGFLGFKEYLEAAGLRVLNQAIPMPGDLLLISVTHTGDAINHCAIYLGENRILHQLWGRESSVQMYTEGWKMRTMFLARP